MPAAGTKQTEEVKGRISATTSDSMRKHWRTPNGQDIQLGRRETRLRDVAIPRSEERFAFWRAKRESLKAELEGRGRLRSTHPGDTFPGRPDGRPPLGDPIPGSSAARSRPTPPGQV